VATAVGAHPADAVSTDVELPAEVARMAATPPDTASGVTTARTPVRHVRNALLMKEPNRTKVILGSETRR